MVRRMMVLCLLVIAATMFGVRPARAGDQDFQLYNRTGVDIYHLYVSPSNADDWQEDLLDGSVLQNGADITIHFKGNSSVANWDIRVEDSEGGYLYWEDINLLEVSEVVLEKNGKARLKE